MNKKYDVACIGHTLMDVQQHVDDDFIRQLSLTKGDRQLIEEARASFLFERMQAPLLTPGGSGANSMAVVASLGGCAAFNGRIGDDAFGEKFGEQMQHEGVHFSAPAPDASSLTGRSFIFITPDGQRTMNTVLGASHHFSPIDVDFNLIAQSRIVLLEGYFCDQPSARAAFEAALLHARRHGTQVAFALSSAACVARHDSYFRDVVREQVDIVLGNEEELMALFPSSADYVDARASLKTGCRLAFVTRGAQGAEVLAPGRQHNIKAAPDVSVVDTTGAGDAFAGGVLHELALGRSVIRAAKVGNLCAAEMISHDGARPRTRLSGFVAERLPTMSARAGSRISV